MCIPDGLLFMWGVVPNFPFAVSVVASQEKPILALQKWKTHFSWDKTKISLRVFLATPRAMHVSDIASFRQTML
jgi:hypothetical protein